MITYIVLYPGDIDTGARFVTDEAPTLELAADALCVHLGFDDRDAMILANPGLTIGFSSVQ